MSPQTEQTEQTDPSNGQTLRRPRNAVRTEPPAPLSIGRSDSSWGRRQWILFGSVASVTLTAGIGAWVGPVLAQARTPTLPGRSVMVLTVMNKIASGRTLYAESPEPAFLSSRPVADCSRQHCIVAGTQTLISGTLVSATCSVHADSYSNADSGSGSGSGSATVEDNPFAFTSTLWYGVHLGTGAKGYLPEALIAPADRDAASLPDCPH